MSSWQHLHVASGTCLALISTAVGTFPLLAACWAPELAETTLLALIGSLDVAAVTQARLYFE